MKILNAKRGSHEEDLEKKNGFAKKAVTASKFIRSHTLIIIRVHIILQFTIALIS